MNGPSSPKHPPALILAGGMGTRLKSVTGDLPKPLVAVAGKPFLFWILSRLQAQGFTHCIVSIGYRAERFLEIDWTREFPALRVSLSVETSPLGTGGAVAQTLTAHPSLWVLNGDTYLPAAIPNPELFPAGTDAMYLALSSQNVFDADPNLHIEKDLVKQVAANPPGAYFDAGAVWLRKEVLHEAPSVPPYSLHALLSWAMAAGKVRYTLVEGTCYDIGTPERLKRFESFLKQENRSHV